jgi:hypothetical protein
MCLSAASIVGKYLLYMTRKRSTLTLTLALLTHACAWRLISSAQKSQAFRVSSILLHRILARFVYSLVFVIYMAHDFEFVRTFSHIILSLSLFLLHC